jgi:hypothetical protein
MPKAIYIDALHREVRKVDYSGYMDINSAVGGYIEGAWMSPKGDVL